MEISVDITDSCQSHFIDRRTDTVGWLQNRKQILPGIVFVLLDKF